ncbi:MAG: hypothetical protein LBR61_06215 [Synergistaceae bacterium]|jgi:hypothetical protein|nr:hypothetical protein [Synergistaceae bacterium]
MGKLRYRLIAEGMLEDKFIPLTIAYIDVRDIRRAGTTIQEAILAVGKACGGPCGINIFDMEAVTTTSDGLMAPGAIICMAAMDRGILNKDFGTLFMAEMPYSRERVEKEPHLIQWEKRYSGRRLFRGPKPATKSIPKHQAVMTGRANNNNSATEMMNIATMEEILLPILGQIQCVLGDGDVLVGYCGGEISVGIGMVVPELYGRVFQVPLFKAGDTSHNSGPYSRTLKSDIQCIVSDKAFLAEHVLNAIDDGCVPGRIIGGSPAVLSVARHYHAEIDYDNITPRAWLELSSVGITRETLQKPTPKLSREEILTRADEIIPGVDKPSKLPVSKVAKETEIEV